MTLSNWGNLLKHDPWSHQLEALEFLETHRAALLAMGVGTGKSMSVVGDVISKAKQQKAVRTLIVCKKSMVDVWEEEFAKHANVSYAITRVSGNVPPKKREEMAIETLESSYYLEKAAIPTILITNFESVWREPLATLLKKGNLDMVVVDESQHIKSAGGKASRYLHRLGKTVPFRRALTATPLHNTPLDAYGQFRYLDDAVFGTSFDAFRMEYANLIPGPSSYIPYVKSYKNLDQLADKMAPLMYSVDQSVLDLPQEVYTHRYGYLPKKQQKIYDELDKDFITWLDKQSTVAPANVLTKLLRLQQLANGFLKDDDGDIHHVNDVKGDLLYDALEEMPPHEPVVVFTRFDQDIAVVREVGRKLDRGVCELSGHRDERKKWQQDGAPPILVVQIQTGNAGISLVRAKYCIYFTLPWSLGDRVQSIGRLKRPGQEHSVTYIDLIVKNTVDEDVAQALKTKTDVVHGVISRIQQRSRT